MNSILFSKQVSGRKHGISIRVRCWCILVSGFEGMRGAGELQKYHVLGVGLWLKKHGISIRERCWNFLVFGFDDERRAGERQKYHVFGNGIVA